MKIKLKISRDDVEQAINNNAYVYDLLDKFSDDDDDDMDAEKRMIAAICESFFRCLAYGSECYDDDEMDCHDLAWQWLYNYSIMMDNGSDGYVVNGGDDSAIIYGMGPRD